MHSGASPLGGSVCLPIAILRGVLTTVLRNSCRRTRNYHCNEFAAWQQRASKKARKKCMSDRNEITTAPTEAITVTEAIACDCLVLPYANVRCAYPCTSTHTHTPTANIHSYRPNKVDVPKLRTLQPKRECARRFCRSFSVNKFAHFLCMCVCVRAPATSTK